MGKKWNKIFYLTFLGLLIACKKEIKPHQFTIPNDEEQLVSNIGQIEDFASLKKFIVEYVALKHEIAPSFFDQATVENTDLLREIVHYTNYKNKTEGRRPKKERYNELGYMFKDKGVGENCGFMGSTLYDVYRAFGFAVKRYDVIDGSLKGFLKYRDSHVFVEVYIPSLEKYIMQDPTINNSAFSCKTQERLSFWEMRKNLYNKDQTPCFLDNEVSNGFSPNSKMTERQKLGILEDYYTASVLSYQKYDGVEETNIKLHDLGMVANENQRAHSLDSFKELCKACPVGEIKDGQSSDIRKFMECLNAKIFAQSLVTKSFDGREKGFLVQFTNEKGQNVLYDPVHDYYVGRSYFEFLYWDLNNKGFLLDRDDKYMVPLKFYSPKTDTVLEF